MVKDNKVRAMITIDKDLLERAKKLCAKECRTLSREIAYLLEREIKKDSN